jgi:hypothetical protein
LSVAVEPGKAERRQAGMGAQTAASPCLDQRCHDIDVTMPYRVMQSGQASIRNLHIQFDGQLI